MHDKKYIWKLRNLFRSGFFGKRIKKRIFGNLCWKQYQTGWARKLWRNAKQKRVKTPLTINNWANVQPDARQNQQTTRINAHYNHKWVYGYLEYFIYLLGKIYSPNYVPSEKKPQIMAAEWMVCGIVCAPRITRFLCWKSLTGK